MVDNPLDNLSPSSSSQLNEGGVAALAPQFDLAVTASARRSAPPIGSLSPQGTPYGPFSKNILLNPPQSSPSLIAADFLQHAARHGQPEFIPTRETAAFANHLHPPLRHPAVSPLSTTPTTTTSSAKPSHILPPLDYDFGIAAFDPSHIPPAHDYDFGIASLDLGPPVFENPISPHHSQHSHQDNHQTSHQSSHRQSSHTTPPLLNLQFHTASSSPLPSPTSTPRHPSQSPKSPIHQPSVRDHQHPTRCVKLCNVPPGIDDDDIRNLLQIYGPLRDLGAQQRARGGRGSVLATYYDLRHARAAVQALDASLQFGRRLDAKYQCPSDLPSALLSPTSSATSPCANQGTLVVFNLDNSTSAEDIRALFNTVGDVKEIRSTPNKKHHKFVEFFDIRDAERAMRTLNKTDVNGKRIKIEISRPGGRAASLTRHANTPASISKHQHHHHYPTHQQQHSQSHQHLNFSHHHPRHIRHQPSHVQYSAESSSPFTTSSPRHAPLDSAGSHIPASLLNSINNTLPLPQHPTFASSPDVTSAFDTRSHPLRADDVAALVASATSYDTSPPSQYSRPESYESAYLNSVVDEGIDYAALHASYDPLGDTRMSPPTTDQRTSDLHRLYSNHVAGLSNKYSSNPTIMQRSTPRYAADSYIQALYSSPGSDEGRTPVSPSGDSALGRCAFTVVKNETPSANGALSDDCSSITGSTNGGTGENSNHAINGVNANNFSNPANQLGPCSQLRKIGGPSQPGTSPVVGDHAYAKPASAAKGNSAAANATGNNKHSYNQQQQQQGNSKYGLDIRKVRTGEEIRTALMIRNIPNKYNQKMLLSTLDEKHRGHFDFIYLPIDFKNKCNVGYAFINLTKPQYIEPFYNTFHGRKWTRFNSEKVCEITFARIQGRQQLIAHFQNSSLLLEDPKCRPVIFDANGRQEEFPIGSHVRTRRGPSSRDASHRACDGSPPYSPTKQRGRS